MKNDWIIFGSNSGIAKALIKSLSENSENRVFCVSRKPESVVDGKNIFYYTTNSFQEKLKGENLKSTNVVFCNGKVFFKKFSDITRSDVEEVLEANLVSVIFYLQSILSADLDIRKVLLIGSNAGRIFGHHKYFSLYAAAKNACLGMFRSLSAEFPGVFFNYYVCPSADTDIFSNGVVDKELLINTKKNEVINRRSPESIAGEIINILENQTEKSEDLIVKSIL